MKKALCIFCKSSVEEDSPDKRKQSPCKRQTGFQCSCCKRYVYSLNAVEEQRIDIQLKGELPERNYLILN